MKYRTKRHYKIDSDLKQYKLINQIIPISHHFTTNQHHENEEISHLTKRTDLFQQIYKRETKFTVYKRIRWDWKKRSRFPRCRRGLQRRCLWSRISLPSKDVRRLQRSAMTKRREEIMLVVELGLTEKATALTLMSVEFAVLKFRFQKEREREVWIC